MIEEETARSKNAQIQEDWDPEWTEKRTCFALRCSACNDITVAIGRLAFEWVGAGHGPDFRMAFFPVALYPMPPMIEVPTACSETIVSEIREGESLFWLSPASACGRLRASVERTLDHIKIPKYSVSKRRRQRLSLHARIERVPSKHSQIRDHLMALKWLGNEGSHEKGLTEHDVLDGLEVLEHALENLFGTKTRNVQAIVKEVIRRRGSRSKPR